MHTRPAGIEGGTVASHRVISQVLVHAGCGTKAPSHSSLNPSTNRHTSSGQVTNSTSLYTTAGTLMKNYLKNKQTCVILFLGSVGVLAKHLEQNSI